MYLTSYLHLRGHLIAVGKEKDMLAVYLERFSEITIMMLIIIIIINRFHFCTCAVQAQKLNHNFR